MRRRRLLWQVYPPLVVAALFGLLTTSALVTREFRRTYLDQVALDLRARAVLFAQALTHTNGESLGLLTRRLGRTTGTRLTVVDAEGRVRADSEHDAASMENHAERPEIAAALRGDTGLQEHVSRTLGVPMMYVAVPGVLAGKPVAVRAAVPLADLRPTLAAFGRWFAWGALAIVLLGALAVTLSLRGVGRGVEDLRAGAGRFAAGELAPALDVPRTLELAELAEALNAMARQLDERLALVLRQRNELAAVLGSMVEAVVAVDADARVLNANPSAAELFGWAPGAAAGHLLHEVVRNRDVQRFVERTLAAEERLAADLVHFDREERYLRATGSPLRDAEGRSLGALIVLHDVTRLHRLENLRRDFAANVSHELRTPITSIQGYVEALQEGALDDPEQARRFLDTIARHTSRLAAIIEDLLTLARLEQTPEAAGLVFATGPLDPVLAAAAQACAAKAAERAITLDLPTPSDLSARHNGSLLESALINLLDNALSYSEPGSTVKVTLTLSQARGEVAIAVTDRGCGIAPENLPRLFERFYRVDRARSRQHGGTGLGLAIVKHIMAVHGGRVEVTSTPGTGSTFTLCVPGGPPRNPAA
jgi:two-component system phosphate regulon sensor histidine kinase PhoR